MDTITFGQFKECCSIFHRIHFCQSRLPKKAIMLPWDECVRHPMVVSENIRLIGGTVIFEVKGCSVCADRNVPSECRYTSNKIFLITGFLPQNISISNYSKKVKTLGTIFKLFGVNKLANLSNLYRIASFSSRRTLLFTEFVTQINNTMSIQAGAGVKEFNRMWTTLYE